MYMLERQKAEYIQHSAHIQVYHEAISWYDQSQWWVYSRNEYTLLIIIEFDYVETETL